MTLLVDGYVKGLEEQWNMIKFQSYSNYASIMASQGISPDPYDKWLKGSESEPAIDTRVNSPDTIAEFEALMNAQEKASRKSK